MFLLWKLIVNRELMWRQACCTLVLLFLSLFVFNAYRMRQYEKIKTPISGSYKVLRSERSMSIFFARRADVAVLRLM